MFNVPENNNYPHAPWWTYSEEENAKEAAGVSACLSAFIIRVFPESDSLYDRAVKEAQLLLARLDEEFALGDMELEGLSELIGAITERELPNFDPKQLKQKLLEKSSKTICTDTARWKEYVKRPSSLITSPASPLYSEYQDIINKELDWTIENRGADGVWPITWQWYGMDNYNREFAISENWWKGMVAIERMQFLRNFGR